MVDPPYTVFHKGKVFLGLCAKFIPKVPFEFHLNQAIHLPVFYAKPPWNMEKASLHSLDIQGSCLLSAKNNSFSEISRVVHCCRHENRKESCLFPKTKWIASCISLCYDVMKAPPPQTVRAHSMIAQVVPVASLQGIPLSEICRAATWGSLHAFTRYSKLWLQIPPLAQQSPTLCYSNTSSHPPLQWPLLGSHSKYS